MPSVGQAHAEVALRGTVERDGHGGEALGEAVALLGGGPGAGLLAG